VKKIVDIYRSQKKEGAYLYLAKGAAVDSIPVALTGQLGRLELAMTLLITPDKKLARADAEKVLRCIDEQGFYLQMPPTITPDANPIPNDKMTHKPL